MSGEMDPEQMQPFGTLEALMEHLGAIRNAYGVVSDSDILPKPKPGTPAYHLDAAEEYGCKLFQQLVILLPEKHRCYEGEE